MSKSIGKCSARYTPSSLGLPRENVAPKSRLQSLRLAEARLADLKATLDDMRAQRDSWQTVAQRLAISDQRPTQRPSQSVQPWWSRLAGIWTQLPSGAART